VGSGDANKKNESGSAAMFIAPAIGTGERCLLSAIPMWSIPIVRAIVQSPSILRAITAWINGKNRAKVV